MKVWSSEKDRTYARSCKHTAHATRAWHLGKMCVGLRGCSALCVRMMMKTPLARTSIPQINGRIDEKNAMPQPDQFLTKRNAAMRRLMGKSVKCWWWRIQQAFQASANQYSAGILIPAWVDYLRFSLIYGTINHINVLMWRCIHEKMTRRL